MLWPMCKRCGTPVRKLERLDDDDGVAVRVSCHGEIETKRVPSLGMTDAAELQGWEYVDAFAPPEVTKRKRRGKGP